MLVCFPMRIEWEKTLPKIAPDDYPEPVHTSRDDWTIPLPTSVMRLASFAREAGWEVRTQFSQGCTPHGATGRPGPLRDLIGVTFGRHPMTDLMAVAVYARPAGGKTWSWQSMVIAGAGRRRREVNMVTLKDYLANPS
jgi:hypothetical protein